MQERSRATQVASSHNYLPFRPVKPKLNQSSSLPATAHQPRRQAPKAEIASEGDSDSVEVIRAKAKRATAGLLQNFKFRTTYGFMPNDEYSLPIHTGGDPPQVAASDLPPRFEQYLIVEATINIDGKVVDARIITGLVEQKIQDKVLAAVREFKYIPAKHNGSPIPSQVDIVVHVPS